MKVVRLEDEKTDSMREQTVWLCLKLKNMLVKTLKLIETTPMCRSRNKTICEFKGSLNTAFAIITVPTCKPTAICWAHALNTVKDMLLLDLLAEKNKINFATEMKKKLETLRIMYCYLAIPLYGISQVYSVTLGHRFGHKF